MRSLLRYAALYAVVELTVVALLIWALGLGWTLLVLAAAFMLGVVLAAAQMRGQVTAVRRARTDPKGAVTDGVLVGLGAFLVFLPGIVSTAAGALILAPPTRSAMRPLAAAMLARGVTRRLTVVNFDHFVADPYLVVDPYGSTAADRGDYIDGEVIGEPLQGSSVGTAVARRTGR